MDRARTCICAEGGEACARGARFSSGMQLLFNVGATRSPGRARLPAMLKPGLTVINMRLEVCKRIVPWLAADRWSGKKIPIWWTGALTSSSSSSLYHGFPPCCSSSLRFLYFFPFLFLFRFNPFSIFPFFFSPFFFAFHGFDSKRFEFRDICNPRRLLLTGELISRAGLKRF